ncbi:MAG: MFS transporter [bacterium]|nr:MFS transporter [bacterium]
MTQNKRQSRIFYGWWVIIACSLIGLLSGASRFSFTIFLPVLEKDLGWTRTMLGFGLTLHLWVYGFIVVITGFIVDKYGSRLIMAIGGVFIFFGLLLTSKITTVTQFYIYYGIILAIGVGFTFAVPVYSTARKWFDKKAGTASAIATAGVGMGLAIVAVVAPDLIKVYGWRDSWFFMGIAIGAAIIIAALLIVRKDPESIGLYPDGIPPQATETPSNENAPSLIWSLQKAAKTRSFWCLLAAYILNGMTLMGILGHIAAWGYDVVNMTGVSIEDAMPEIKLCVFLISFNTVLGTLTGGPLSDKFGRKAIFITAFTLYGLNFLYLTTVDSLTGIVIGGGLAGFFIGLKLPLWTTTIGDIYGRNSVGSLFGIITFASAMIGGTGPVIFGWIFDTYKSYNPAWVLSSILCAIIVLLLALVKYKKSHYLLKK